MKSKMDRLLASIFDGFWWALGSKLRWKIEPRAKQKRLKNAWRGFRRFARAFWKFLVDFRKVQGDGR